MELLYATDRGMWRIEKFSTNAFFHSYSHEASFQKIEEQPGRLDVAAIPKHKSAYKTHRGKGGVLVLRSEIFLSQRDQCI